MHNSTGVSPAELMFGRNLRTKLPEIENVICKMYLDQKRGAREVI